MYVHDLSYEIVGKYILYIVYKVIILQWKFPLVYSFTPTNCISLLGLYRNIFIVVYGVILSMRLFMNEISATMVAHSSYNIIINIPIFDTIDL